MKPNKIIDHVKSLKTKDIMEYGDAEEVIEREVKRKKIPREHRNAMTKVLYTEVMGGRNHI